LFHSKTVFIVGAGASCEFGLPSGAEIKAKIGRLIDIRFQDGYSLSSGDFQIVECFRRIARQDDQLNGNINPILQKCWLVRDALPAAISIDNLLHAHQGDEYIELAGKLGIVKAILEAERGSVLKPGERHPPAIDLKRIEATWLMSFFKMASEGITRSSLDQLFENVTIICFNYDRCIEWFLPHAIHAYYGVDQQQASDLAAKLTIVHPYGTVGPLQKVAFGSTETNIVDAAKTILTFSEGLSDENLTGRIRTEVEDAETIVFLGFAFHPMNVALLTPGEESFVSRIFATSYGLSDEDESVIEDDILGMVHKDRVVTGEYGLIDANPSYVPKFANVTCAEFFAKFFRSLSAAKPT
jgi:hypothetical protein